MIYVNNVMCICCNSTLNFMNLLVLGSAVNLVCENLLLRKHCLSNNLKIW